MGLSFSFREEDKIQFGRCGEPKQTFVEVSLPQRPGDIPEGKIFSPDLESHFVRNTRRTEDLALTGMPEEGGGYAILYTRFIHPLTEAEAAKKYRAWEEENTPLDLAHRAEIIDAEVARFVCDLRLPLGISLVAGMVINKGVPTISENRFIRWVSKKEFESVVAEVKQKLGEDYDGEDCPVSAYDQWNFQYQTEDKRRHCVRCDLNTTLVLNPVIERVIRELDTLSEKRKRIQLLRSVAGQFMEEGANPEQNPYAATAFSSAEERGRFQKFLSDEIEAYPELGVLSERFEAFRISKEMYGAYLPGCYRGSSYSHMASFKDFLAKRGNFPAVLQFLSTENEEVDAETCRNALEELIRVKELVKDTQVAAIETFDEQGKVIKTYPYEGDGSSGNSSQGYGYSLENDEVDYITIEHKTPDIFSVPLEQRRKFVDEKDIGGLIEEAERLREAAGNFKVTEVWREKDTYFCKLRSGNVLELPAETEKIVVPAKAIDSSNSSDTLTLLGTEAQVTSTPFAGFMERNKMHRMRITKAPASMSFDFLVNLIEKQASISVQFDIPVTLG